MKVKVDYDRSEIVEFQSDADKGHSYLRLIFVPEKMSLLERATKGRSSEYQMNFYPQRDNEGAINQEFEDAIIDAFNNCIMTFGNIFFPILSFKEPFDFIFCFTGFY